jgi:hypothetical protein
VHVRKPMENFRQEKLSIHKPHTHTKHSIRKATHMGTHTYVLTGNLGEISSSFWHHTTDTHQHLLHLEMRQLCGIFPQVPYIFMAHVQVLHTMAPPKGCN